ncbi:signal peptidase I [Actinoplanes sp. NPDC023801]|uniref:signal peptidase I n=1 Tax=Actinoplanes sp. NPDC023801 TaxID=3154595 RepID=UPI0033F274AC
MNRAETGAWARIAMILAARITIGTACVAVLWSLAPVPFGWTSVVVTSGSMEPRIRTGDVAIASPADGDDMQPGQPVLTDNPVRPGTLLLHRVVRRNPDRSLVTKGDANRTEDSTPVPPAAVVGRPRLLVRYIGLPMYWHGIGEHRKVVVTVVVSVMLTIVAARRTDDEEFPGVAPPVTSSRTRAGVHRYRRRRPAHRLR